jgi:hypothetical protein
MAPSNDNQTCNMGHSDGNCHLSSSFLQLSPHTALHSAVLWVFLIFFYNKFH